MDIQSSPVTFVSNQCEVTLTPKDQLLKDIQSYMELHMHEQLSIAQLCTVFSIGHSTLHALFYAEHKCGAIDYYNRQKIKMAKRILRESTMNFTEIARYLSYHSLQHFSKQFKKATGLSPSEYRNSIKSITS